MAILWTDVITPAELTGYVRASLSDYEAMKGTLARWLPNKEVADAAVRMMVGQNGLVEEAKYRAYDAEPEMGKRQRGKRLTIELPAVGQNMPVSEYLQLRLRNASDDAVRNEILSTALQVTRAVADRTERMRGTVLATGKATINQDNYVAEDDFGRDPSLTITASTLWTTPAVDRLAALQTWTDLYNATNGVDAAAMVMSKRVFRALQSGTQFATQLGNGASRPALADELRGLITGAGLPDIYLYDRRTSAGRILPDDTILILPAPADPNAADVSELGQTFWGQTLTGMDPDWAIQASEQPGIVAGVYRNPKPPMIAEVISDAIALPILANANLSMAVKVL